MKELKELKRILESHKRKLKKPDLRYNPKDKHIRVTHDFEQGYIPGIKIKAPRELWLEWYCNFDQIKFDTIKPYLSRIPKKTLKALTEYAEQDPQGFMGGMFYCVQVALEENPLYSPRVKARKPSEYDLKWHDINKISNTSIRLHDYLHKIKNYKEFDRPDYLKKFLNVYGISALDLLDVKDAVRKVMSKYYGVDFKERFWQTFVTDRPISLRQIRKLAPDPSPENDEFLKELFKEFM